MFECGQLGHNAKECSKRTAVETKSMSDETLLRIIFGHMEAMMSSVFHVGRNIAIRCPAKA